MRSQGFFRTSFALRDMTPTQARVTAICADVLGLVHLDLDDDLYEVGSDSHQAVLVALEIESAFSVEMPIELMEGSANVRALAAWVDERLSADAAPSPRGAAPGSVGDV
ncbi:acyl carrier protein [Lichenibacterium dinghuense]|uniref:acyl carrier protein n=1 Tax=Lichenibacterium dinghuense TaxID=2895977 RepID=UPI001F34C1D8|nr:phosphopantetheine-binding protein [Lichenibacterium sp. 6Y81]